MRTVFATTMCAMACAAVFAQTPTTTAASRNSEGQTLNNEERNIRAYIELLRTDIKKSKAQVMGEVMRLDTDEAQKFWPIYKEFETEMAKLGDQVVAAVKTYAANYDTMTDSVANQLANQVLSIEQQRNGLKKKYYERFKASVGAVTAMRFLQVENQLERLLDLQLASQLPVIGQ